MELRTSPLRGPARALRAGWTARGQRSRVAHRLPTLSRLSPTASTGPTTISIQQNPFALDLADPDPPPSPPHSQRLRTRTPTA